MFYKSSIGVISRSLLPEETISWSVPDLISIKKITEYGMITSPWFSYHGDVWCLALTCSATSLRIFAINSSNLEDVEYKFMGLFLWRKYPGEFQNEKVTLAMNINRQVNERVRILPETFTGEISGSLDSLGNFGKYNFLRIDDVKNLKSVISPTGRLYFTCMIKKQEQITEQIMSVQEISENEVSEESSNENNTEVPKLEGVQEISENEVSEESSNENNTEVPKLEGTDRLIENLKSLCLDGRHSDFVLRVDGHEFRVHKGILGARSPVFAAMFEHDMEETKKGKVDIPDCVASAFDIFLLYLYTGYAENLSQDNIFDVYYAADKYRVDDLKAECLELIKSTLSVNSFCDAIALSVRHNEKVLLREATCFFKENIKEIIKTVNWQKFLTENPIQANELLIKALNN